MSEDSELELDLTNKQASQLRAAKQHREKFLKSPPVKRATRTFDVAVDWGGRAGKLVAYSEHTGLELWQVLTNSLAEQLPIWAKKGVRSVVIERSFGWDPQEPDRVLAVGKEVGIEIWKVTTKGTQRFRENILGIVKEDNDKEKSEFLDAFCIYYRANWLGCAASILKPQTAETHERWAARKADPIGRSLIARTQGYSETDPEFQRLAAYLPDLKAKQEFPEWVWESQFLENKIKKKWVVTHVFPILAVAEDVALKGGGRKEFDRRCGYCELGYGNLIRSNFYRSQGESYMKKKLNLGRKSPDNTSEEVRKARREGYRLHRRIYRWMFHQVANKVRVTNIIKPVLQKEKEAPKKLETLKRKPITANINAIIRNGSLGLDMSFLI